MWHHASSRFVDRESTRFVHATNEASERSASTKVASELAQGDPVDDLMNRMKSFRAVPANYKYIVQPFAEGRIGTQSRPEYRIRTTRNFKGLPVKEDEENMLSKNYAEYSWGTRRVPPWNDFKDRDKLYEHRMLQQGLVPDLKHKAAPHYLGVTSYLGE